jgi:ADP-ribosylglycohydrolase
MKNDHDALDPEVRRIIDQARRADELRAKYRIDMKMTFFSPDARPDDLGNVCPICLARTPTSARYADYVCERCTGRAVDEHGEHIVFGNADFSGGVVARVNGEKRDVTTCFIDGRPCAVTDGRFGGVVYSLAGVREVSVDPSRRGNRLGERVAGSVLGAAIGFEMGQRAGRGPVDTDEPQLAEVALGCLLDARRESDDLDGAMKRLRDALAKFPASRGTEDAETSGAVVRAFAVGLVFPEDVGAREAWALAQAALSDQGAAALAASSAMAHGTASALVGDAVLDTVNVMVENAARHDTGAADRIARAASAANSGESTGDVLARFQGRTAHEMLATATYVFVRHPDDFRAAVLEATSGPGDGATIATLVGAWVGARCGTNAIAAEWRRDVKRRDALAALGARTLSESGYIDWDDVLAQLSAIGR